MLNEVENAWFDSMLPWFSEEKKEHTTQIGAFGWVDAPILDRLSCWFVVVVDGDNDNLILD